MTTNLRAFRYTPHTFPHVGPVRPSLESGNMQNDAPSGNMPHVPRRMIAVTVALSEPMDSEPLDWPATIASLMRLTYANTTVEVIDTWSPSEEAQLGLQQSERVDE